VYNAWDYEFVNAEILMPLDAVLHARTDIILMIGFNHYSCILHAYTQCF